MVKDSAIYERATASSSTSDKVRKVLGPRMCGVHPPRWLTEKLFPFTAASTTTATCKRRKLEVTAAAVLHFAELPTSHL